MNTFRGGTGVTTGRYAPVNVYVLGRTSLDEPLTNQVYNTADDVWSTAKGMLTHRQDFGVAVVDDVLYVIGGNNYGWRGGGADILSLNEQYVPIGYNPQNYPNTQPSVTASSGFSEVMSKFFLNNFSAIVVLVLIVCICAGSAIFLFKSKKKLRGFMYE
ncbi:MAG: hypothetical protein LBB87_01285 [Nitrososphaerota archaeon]|nr:hypothetical protein [Nitrososphaerota archaeon]